MIDPTFRNINRLFVISFRKGNNGPTRNSFGEYYMLLVEMKNFNALIENKTFFDQSVKNKQEAYERLNKMSKNDDCTTANLLDYLYHQSCYKRIGIDLSTQTNESILQQINFVGKLEENHGATTYFIAEKQQKIILNFSLHSLIVTEF